MKPWIRVHSVRIHNRRISVFLDSVTPQHISAACGPTKPAIYIETLSKYHALNADNGNNNDLIM